jgi:hypothetical protein
MSHSVAHDILPTSLAKSEKRPGFCLQPSRLHITDPVRLCWKRAGDFWSCRFDSRLRQQPGRISSNPTRQTDNEQHRCYLAAVPCRGFHYGADGGRHIKRSFSDPAHRRECRKQSTADAPGLRDTAFGVQHKTRTGMEPLNSPPSAQRRACRAS